VHAAFKCCDDHSTLGVVQFTSEGVVAFLARVWKDVMEERVREALRSCEQVLVFVVCQPHDTFEKPPVDDLSFRIVHLSASAASAVV
jgi:hypothetical protein